MMIHLTSFTHVSVSFVTEPFVASRGFTHLYSYSWLGRGKVNKDCLQGMLLRNILLANLRHGPSSKKSSGKTIIIIRCCVDGCLSIGEPATGAVLAGKKWIQPSAAEVVGWSADHSGVMQQNSASRLHQVCPGNSLNVWVNQSERPLSSSSSLIPLRLSKKVKATLASDMSWCLLEECNLELFLSY